MLLLSLLHENIDGFVLEKPLLLNPKMLKLHSSSSLSDSSIDGSSSDSSFINLMNFGPKIRKGDGIPGMYAAPAAAAAAAPGQGPEPPEEDKEDELLER